MRKLISILLVGILLVLSPLILGQDAGSEPGEEGTGETAEVYYIEQGERAPFPGTLLNSQAAAEIIAHEEAMKEQCLLDVSQAQEELQASCDLTVGQANAELLGERERHQIVVTTLEEENARWRESLSEFVEEDEDDILWVIVGFVAGGAVVGATAWLLN